MWYCYYTCLKLKLSVWLIKHHATKIYGRADVQLQTILTLALSGGGGLSCQLYTSAHIPSTRGPHGRSGQVQTRKKNLPEIELWLLRRPAWILVTILNTIFRSQISLKELHTIHTWSLSGSFRRKENFDLYAKMREIENTQNCGRGSVVNKSIETSIKKYMVRMGDGWNWLRTVVNRGPSFKWC
jgi:hypothetical protein